MIDRTTKWGNPYSLINFSRAEALEKYKIYLLNNENLLKDILELDGKILGCWCKPKACHGDVIIEVINRIKLERLFQ